MCDPVTIGLSLVAASSVAGMERQRKSASQAAQAQRDALAAEEGKRAAAEVKAAGDANARLAQTQRRRREQGGLLSKGAPTDQPSVLDAPLSSEGRKTAPATPASPLLMRGAPATFYG